MCCSCLGGGFLPPRLDGDDRFDAGGCTRGGHEFARVGDGFEIHHDCAGLAFTGKHVEPVADVDVGHVAQRHDMREADIVVRSPVDQRCRNGAGLREQCNIAGLRCQVRKPCVELQWRNHQPERVGPDDPKQCRLRGVEHRLPQPVLTRQPGGDDDGGTRALLAEFADDDGDRLAGA